MTQRSAESGPADHVGTKKGAVASLSPPAMIRFALRSERALDREGRSGQIQSEGFKMRKSRLAMLLTSVLVSLTVFAPAAAWAEMIVKPGH
jgi:hypothetical protein